MSTLSTTRMQRLWQLLAFLTLVLFFAWLMCPPANAAPSSVSAEADLSWTLPTTDTLGQPLIGDRALQKIQVFVGTEPIPDVGATPAFELPAGSTTFVYTGAVPNGSTLHFRLAACSALCSSLTGTVTKEIRVSVPTVPTGVTVTLRVNLNVSGTP